MAKILIAEDEKVYGKIYEDKLVSEGHKVIVASNGEEAVSVVKKESPDLLILDLIMPKMDGFEVLRKLGREIESGRLKVIVLSNLGQESDEIRTRALGAVKYLVKVNTSMSALLEAVDEVLGI